jgi:uncharacterized protein YndB with AHSA1/START domain
MIGDSLFLVTVRRRIAAEPQHLFDIVADPAQHPLIDGSGTLRALRAGAPQRLFLGAEFGMDMHLARDYRTENTVTEYDEPRLIAWHHFNGHVWRYRFEPVDGGTEVTEQWDARGIWNRPLLIVLGFRRRARDGMTATLERLDALVTVPR